MTIKIPPKGVSFSDFICIFAMSCYDYRLIFNRNTKLSEKSDMTKSWAARLAAWLVQELFVA